MVFNDIFAMGLLSALQQAGVSVPGDLSTVADGRLHAARGGQLRRGFLPLSAASS